MSTALLRRMMRGRSRFPGQVSGRAVALWRARAYDGVRDSLLDLSGNGINARLGSTVGADAADPLRLPYAGQKDVYFPGSAGNSLTIPLAAGTYAYTITYHDGTTDADSQIVVATATFGGTDAKFAGKRVRLIVVTLAAVEVARFTAHLAAEPYASYTDGFGIVWTINRSATGRKLAVVDRDIFLLATDDYFEVADHPLINFDGSQPFTVTALVRLYGAGAGYFFGKGAENGGGVDPGWNLRVSAGTSRIQLEPSGSARQDTTVAGPTVGIASLIAGLMYPNRTSQGFVNGSGGTIATATAVGTFANTKVLRIFSAQGTAFVDGEFIAGAIFRESLNVADLVRLRGELLA